METLGLAQVLETMVTKIPETHAVEILVRDELVDRLGDEHLPALRRRESRSSMHRNSHVVAAADESLTRVEPHADADLPALRPLCFREPALAGRRSGEGVGGTGERDEEGVAFGVHFNTPMGEDRLAEQTVMLREDGRVRLATQFVQQTGRPFDVREKEGDRAGGEPRLRYGPSSVGRLVE